MSAVPAVPGVPGVPAVTVVEIALVCALKWEPTMAPIEGGCKRRLPAHVMVHCAHSWPFQSVQAVCQSSLQASGSNVIPRARPVAVKDG